MKKSTAKYLYLTALLISILSFLIALISDLFITLVSPNFSIRLLILALSSIFLGILITIGLSVFSPILSDTMITLRRLLRFESLSNPLLLRLASEAPGTYHHSSNVSNLAQKAAKAINADSLLVRTAAYYHDIGKLENPLLYVENQSGIEVPTEQDSASIRKNAKAIISHVAKGVQIAKDNNLPEEIIDLIREHHGTTYALYFYGIAKERGLKIKKTDFRYSGPVPQSKESVILMLADCVEATAKAQSNLTPEKIKAIVENAIHERLTENQFKNANLLNHDLAKIKTSLEETLNSIYHQRIEYPKESTKRNNEN